MKKKITAIFLCVALLATAIVGASLAYFTDTDNETNTFTVGNVKIDLIEQQVNSTDYTAMDIAAAFLKQAIGGVELSKEEHEYEDALAGEVFGAVEAHVFEEMGKTVLVVFFLESADVSSEIEFAALCRLVVVTDEVGHAVFQLTDFDSRVGGQRLELLSKSRQYENKSDCR